MELKTKTLSVSDVIARHEEYGVTNKSMAILTMYLSLFIDMKTLKDFTGSDNHKIPTIPEYLGFIEEHHLLEVPLADLPWITMDAINAGKVNEAAERLLDMLSNVAGVKTPIMDIDGISDNEKYELIHTVYLTYGHTNGGGAKDGPISCSLGAEGTYSRETIDKLFVKEGLTVPSGTGSEWLFSCRRFCLDAHQWLVNRNCTQLLKTYARNGNYENCI